MRQIVQHMGTGNTELLEAPVPSLLPGSLLIRSTHSLISAGTERMLVDFGRASCLPKHANSRKRFGWFSIKSVRRVC